MSGLVFDNILLISGSGRNSGKTTFACNIIKKISSREKVIGLKISPHVHITNDNQIEIEKGENYVVYKETDTLLAKDSSRMLAAGANEVYFVLCDDENLKFIDSFIERISENNQPIVCESGSFAGRYIAGKHILVEGNNPDYSKESFIHNREKADLIIKSDTVFNGNVHSGISYYKNVWYLNS